MSFQSWLETVAQAAADRLVRRAALGRSAALDAAHKRYGCESLEQRLLLTAATQLAFASSLAGAQSGGTVQPIVVDVKDAAGNIVTTDSSAVTITLNTGTFSTGVNSAKVNAVNGIATFTGLIINAPGTYALSATDASLTSAASNSFNIYIGDTIAKFGLFPSGTTPGPLIADPNGNFFTTMAGGGTFGDGAVVEMAKGSSTLTAIASFNGSNGISPEGGVTLDAAGDIFGTTGSGGLYNQGTVFEIAEGSNAITTLATFNGTNGSSPNDAPTLDGNGDLFGTTSRGGATNPNDGTVFELPRGSSTITALANFSGANGDAPEAGVVFDSSGDLFGTASNGGSGNGGTLFEIPHGSTTLTAVVNFANFVGDSQLIIDSNNNLFGTCYEGGTNHYGTLFEVAAGSATLTTLATFTGANGEYVENYLTRDANGDFFGTTLDGTGAAAGGAIFELPQGSAQITVLANFNGTNLQYPNGGVIPDAAGNLFGTSSSGTGADTFGAVFELPHGASAVSIIYTCSSSTGYDPLAAPTVDSNGDLFGTLNQGGTYNDGGIYEIASGSGTATSLAIFNGTNGRNPASDVSLDSKGDLFGTTSSGGQNGLGTVFEVAAGSNALTTLASFSGSTGYSPGYSLTLDPTGDVFGVTSSGKSTVFEIASGTSGLTTLATFSSSTTAPQGPLAIDTSGDIFGATLNGGASNLGSIFEIASGGSVITTLASFNGTNGSNPQSGVVADANGDLFGAAKNGGSSSDGTVFELAAGASAITVLGNFTSSTGTHPSTPVALDSQGDIFGAASTTSSGEMFEIPRGSNSIVDVTGGSPYGVALDAAGDLFNLTTFSNTGGIVEYTPAAPLLTFTQSPQTIVAGNSPALQVSLQFPGRPADGTYSGTVTLSLNGGVFANGKNTTVSDTVNGLATLLNVPINTAGSYTITASFSPAQSITSAPFTVLPGPADHLVRVGLPSSNQPGTTVSVEVEDILGNIVSSDTSNVTMQLAGGTFAGGAASITAATVNGVATFNNLDINAANVCTLTISDGALAPLVISVYPSYSDTTAYTFPAAYPDGDGPECTPVFDKKGDLFGTASSGGSFSDGAVFELPAGSTQLTTLCSFTGANGLNPYAGLTIDAAGDLFGTTLNGGASGHGTVFEIAAGTNVITTVGNFSTSGASGPSAGPVAFGPGGTLVGTTLFGPTGSGAIFEDDPRTGIITSPASFSSGSYANFGVVLDAAGDLFGASMNGGSSGDGYIFELPNGSSSITTVAPFTGSNGANPGGVIIDSAGDLFGSTQSGGANSDGTIFEIPAATTTITTLASFSSATGYMAQGLTLDSSGNLLGGALAGGANSHGTVFELPQGASVVTALASFNAPGAVGVDAPVFTDGTGNIFGTTAGGGTNNIGAVFELPSGSSSITTLASFPTAGGNMPQSGLTADAAGDLFGTTSSGGSLNAGTIFEIPFGTTAATIVHSFNETDGWFPDSPLTLDSAGDLFGVTSFGGANNDGVVFELPYGATSPIAVASFTGTNGSDPNTAVALDASGDIFGTTLRGGTGNGTVYEIAAGTNTVTAIANFTSSTGTSCYSALVIDSQGDLFGTLSSGGVTAYGNVFEVAHGTNAITTLAAFNNINGSGPAAGLVMDSTGNLYGTTQAGGASGKGTIFEIPSGSNSITTLTSFNGVDARSPDSTLLLDGKGDLFGISGGGANNAGTVFEFVPGADNPGILFSFGGNSGSSPTGTLWLDSRGNVFGATFGGGAGNAGVVFELTMASSGIIPEVAGVSFSSSGWSTAFPAYGGYAIPSGPIQSNDLPWINLDTISIRFNESVNITQNALTVAGVNQATYTASGFSYNASTETATWTFAAPFGADKLLLNLASSGANAVTDAAGTALDGEWSNGASAFPSGNQTAGGDFNFNVNILPGDVDGNGSVSIVDTVATRNRQFNAVGSANYAVNFDVDGSGSISIIDTIDVRNRQFTSLPSSSPSLPAMISMHSQASTIPVAKPIKATLISPVVTVKPVKPTPITVKPVIAPTPAKKKPPAIVKIAPAASSVKIKVSTKVPPAARKT